MLEPASAWAFEPKLDGWRVLVYTDGNLTVRTPPAFIRPTPREVKRSHASRCIRLGDAALGVMRPPPMDSPSTSDNDCAALAR